MDLQPGKSLWQLTTASSDTTSSRCPLSSACLPVPASLHVLHHRKKKHSQCNNGVYRAGFATTQKAYEAAVVPLFESLDRIEKILDGKDYLVGNTLTEADVR